MLSREYAPIPLNVVRTYRIQYLLVLDSFLKNFSKYPPNYKKLHNYFKVALHLTKISTGAHAPSSKLEEISRILKVELNKCKIRVNFGKTASCQMRQSEKSNYWDLFECEAEE